ncbi:MAG TPA: GldG family protein [Burkholderiales bacterium]|nr:GldG family protein [Burkholderiales bacterium]
MDSATKMRWRLRAQNGVFVLLLAALVALLAFFAHQYRYERDLTQNARNTLSQQTRELLGKLAGPIRITIFATRQNARSGDLHKLAQDFLTPYQRAKPDLGYAFVDPREDPQRTQAAGIRANGEMVIEYNRRTEHLIDYNEQAFVNALMRLARSGERLVMALIGHGERRINGIANHDLGEFGKQLVAKGFKTSELNLEIAQEVPANAALLIIAGPQVDLQPAEVEKIGRYVQSGGNLLWLIDPEPLHGLQPLAETLGLVLGPGVVVDPAAQQFNASPAMAIAASYDPRHPITTDFHLNSVFPFARQIEANEGGDWRVTRLVEVAPHGWVETGKLDNQVTFNKARDVPGPINVAVALERSVEDRAQRVVVVGTGNFLSNTFLGNGGNIDLGVNIINWLASDENLITLQPRSTVDGELQLGRGAQYFLLYGFLIFLPLTFAGTGFAIWWRRRRA